MEESMWILSLLSTENTEEVTFAHYKEIILSMDVTKTFS